MKSAKAIISGHAKRNRPSKTRNSGSWTESRFNSFIVSILRKSSNRWGPRNECKKEARYHKKLVNSSGRLVFHSQCALCERVIPETTSSVDHINPVVDPHVGFVSWDEYISRMFCEVEGFQTLCAHCHDDKTTKERAIATERKRRERTQ